MATGRPSFVAHGDLRFTIGANPLGALGTRLAEAGQLAVEAVGEHHRSRHELRGLIGGVTKHDTLVAGTHLGVLLAFGLTLVDALGDIGRLLREQVRDEDLIGVEDVVVIHVADLADGGADDFLEINLRLGGEFAGDDNVVALDQGLASDARETVLREARIEDGVRDAVGNLVRVALPDGLGGEDEGSVACHRTLETNQRRNERQGWYPDIRIERCVKEGAFSALYGWKRLAVRKSSKVTSDR